MKHRKIRTDGRWIKDDQGRILLLRGVNFGSAAKLPPFLPCDPSRAEENFRRLKGYGFSIVRLIMTWEGIEPSRGTYDIAYLDQVTRVVDAAGSAGIPVILDMHQDLFCRIFGGDGSPEWAAVTDAEMPVVPQPWPFPPSPNSSPPYSWFNYYFSPAVMATFDNFWTNPDLLEHFINAFVEVAKRFRDHPAVIGYELFNEPFPGSLPFNDPDFEEKRLQPFFEKVIPKIRSIDPDSLIFFESSVATNMSGKTFMKKMPFPNIVFAPHYYEMPGEGSSRDKAVSHFSSLEKHCRQELGNIPWILGEFGLGVWGPSNPGTPDEIRPQLEILDELFVGWTYWNYNAPGMPDWNAENMSIINSDGTEHWVVDYIARPYPLKTAGIPKKLSFDMAIKVMRFEFEEDKSASGPTEIFIPADRHFKNGFNIELSDGKTTWEPSTGILSFAPDRSRSSHTLIVSPK